MRTAGMEEEGEGSVSEHRDLELLGAEERGRRKGFGQGMAAALKGKTPAPAKLMDMVNEYLKDGSREGSPRRGPITAEELQLADGCPLYALAMRAWCDGWEECLKHYAADADQPNIKT